MSTLSKKDYQYHCVLAEAEREAMHLPAMKILTKTQKDILTANEKLFSGSYDLANLRLWVYQFPVYENSFKSNLRNSERLRQKFRQNWKNTEDYIEYLYQEYSTWLTYMQTLDIPKNTSVKPLKKYYTTFFSKYNKVYYLAQQHQKLIRQYNYQLNPLILYWFDCQCLGETLTLPRFTMLLPKVDVLWQKVTKLTTQQSAEVN